MLSNDELNFSRAGYRGTHFLFRHHLDKFSSKQFSQKIRTLLFEFMVSVNDIHRVDT